MLRNILLFFATIAFILSLINRSERAYAHGVSFPTHSFENPACEKPMSEKLIADVIRGFT